MSRISIRRATEKDIPDIVSLLRRSLGESLILKTEQYWRWKHIQNPFGLSPVLIALDGNRVVGVRAFMRWKWERDGELVEAVRAVDTATDPEYQGRGIFRRLTLAQLEDCARQGIQMVFNTPNQKSKPGYLKMHWKEAGRLPVSLRIVRPGRMMWNILSRRGTQPSRPEPSNAQLLYFLNHPQLEMLVAKARKKATNLYTTPHSRSSLVWRYRDVPVATYYGAGIENSTLEAVIFYRLKMTRLGVEFRITDFYSNGSIDALDVRNLIEAEASVHKPDYITWGGFGNSKLKTPFTMNDIPFGPMVTIRSVATAVNSFSGFAQWQPSIGDLELF